MPTNFDAACLRSRSVPPPSTRCRGDGSSRCGPAGVGPGLRHGARRHRPPRAGDDGTRGPGRPHQRRRRDPLIYRALDAAARSLLVARDPAPLLRLYAQRLAVDEEYTGSRLVVFRGLYLAVSCLDYPQLFPMTVAPATGRRSGGGRGRARSRHVRTVLRGEWLAQDQNTEAYTACTGWPTPTEAVPPTTGTLPSCHRLCRCWSSGGSSIPGLRRSTCPGSWVRWGAPAVRRAGQLDPRRRRGDQPCGSTLVQAFVRAPTAIDSLDTSCAAAVPPIRAVGPTRSRSPGSRRVALVGQPASTGDLRLAAAAVATAGTPWPGPKGSVPSATSASTRHGPPGSSGDHLTLVADQLVPGVAVTGTVHVGATTVTARLTATGPGALPSTWTPRGHRSVRLPWPRSRLGRRTGPGRYLPGSLTGPPALPARAGGRRSPPSSGPHVLPDDRRDGVDGVDAVGL